MQQPHEILTQIEYSISDYEKIKKGFIPQGMEDKAFLYFEADCLHIYRSWTGKVQAELYFKASEKGFVLYKVVVDLATYSPSYELTDENEINGLQKLIKYCLLNGR